MPKPGGLPPGRLVAIYLPDMRNWPATIIFDFDGVIVNSEPLHCRAFQETIAAESISLSEEEYYSELIGFDDKGAFAHLYHRHGRELDAATFTRLMDGKEQRMRQLIRQRQYAALPGVEPLVRGLARHYPLAICSGALRHEIESMLDGIDLRQCFPIIVSAEDVTVGKPDPACYLLTMRRLSQRMGRLLAPADCLVVEDAPLVAQSARAAGFPVLAVATTYPKEMLSVANWAVDSLAVEQVRRQLPELRLDD